MLDPCASLRTACGVQATQHRDSGTIPCLTSPSLLIQCHNANRNASAMGSPEVRPMSEKEENERRGPRRWNRREFLKWVGLGAAGLAAGCGKEQASAPSAKPPPLAPMAHGVVAVAEGGSPAKMVELALKPLGGIEAFVKKGSFVVLKPNIGWQRLPEQAANTNPEVVGAVVRLCMKAGASRVLVVEHTCDQPSDICFEMSGIQQAVRQAGGEIMAANREAQYEPLDLPYARELTVSTVAKEVRRADCFINIPIAKDHSQARLSIGMKNLMGVVWDRQEWHRSRSLDQCIADYLTGVRPHLTIVDAVRILVGMGPKGPGPTKDTRQVIASVDAVAADAFAAMLFGLSASDVEYLRLAGEMGLGETNPNKMKILRA